jgi:hypothetical protein
MFGTCLENWLKEMDRSAFDQEKASLLHDLLQIGQGASWLEWGAAGRADEREDAMHELVCQHEMSLEQGQAVFLGSDGDRKYVERR